MLVLATAAWAEPPAAPQSPRPALWLLADEDTKIYLFGTVHVLSPGLEWRSPAIDGVIEEADELVLEVTESDAQAAMDSLQGEVLLGKDVPLTQRVSPDRRQALRSLLERTGLPVESFDGVQTWFAAMMIGMAANMPPGHWGKAQGQPPSGVEEVLEAEFSRRRRPISGVETPQMQLGFFSGLPQPVQRRLLEETIDAVVDSGGTPANPAEERWLVGDVEGIAAEMEVLPPELFVVLLTQRNRAWTQWLIDRLERPGTILFAVGAGHLAGTDSLQSMLEGRGLSVTRLE